MNERVASIDIGSTFTKGALFAVGGGTARVLRRAVHPTTRHDLGEGFFRVLAELGGAGSGGNAGPAGTPRVRFSSSAKGGLRIAAVGLVPDLTLQVARLAAWSAGGRIVGDSAYRLTPETMEKILAGDPDIILLSGGTEGGNERFVLANARVIAASPFSGTVLYAGNSAVRESALAILVNKKTAAADNVMPEIGKISIESARERIQRIFLDTIVHGRGLDKVRDFCGAEPKPTPAAVFELVTRIGELRPDWGDFCVVDPGGATTDFYSCGEAYRGAEGVLLKGIHEPRVKRTVEGDLGLRISAESLLSGAGYFLKGAAAERGLAFEALAEYAARVTRLPEHRPGTDDELRFDSMMCEAAVALSALRHAGSLEAVYYPAGKVFLQQGKDLRPCGRLIGTGGFLSRHDAGAALRRALSAVRRGVREEKIPLLPEEFRYFRDALHLFPLLGNLAGEFPEESTACALENLLEDVGILINGRTTE